MAKGELEKALDLLRSLNDADEIMVTEYRKHTVSPFAISIAAAILVCRRRKMLAEVQERIEAQYRARGREVPAAQPINKLDVGEEAVPEETTELDISKQTKRLSLEDTRKLLEEEVPLNEQTEGSSKQYLVETPCSSLY
jgi:hypothetical protein